MAWMCIEYGSRYGSSPQGKSVCLPFLLCRELRAASEAATAAAASGGQNLMPRIG